MEHVNKTTSAVNPHGAAQTNSESKHSPMPEPVADTLVFCGEDGMFSCLNPLITYVASLFSSCLAFIQGLWVAAPAPANAPVHDAADPHHVSQVNRFCEKWMKIAEDMVTDAQRLEWRNEFCKLCDKAKSPARDAFKAQNSEYKKSLDTKDRGKIAKECASFMQELIVDGDFAKDLRQTMVDMHREDLEVELAIGHYPCDTAVLAALNKWSQEQLQHA